jgi:hypothetical protein
MLRQTSELFCSGIRLTGAAPPAMGACKTPAFASNQKTFVPSVARHEIAPFPLVLTSVGVEPEPPGAWRSAASGEPTLSLGGLGE